MNTEIFTTSVIVHCRQENSLRLAQVLTQSSKTDIAFEVALTDVTQGKIIVLLEANNMATIQNWISKTRELKPVLSVSMVYQHADTTASLNEVIA